MSLFDKLKSIQTEAETKPEETPQTCEPENSWLAREDVLQCECGSDVAGECPDCVNRPTPAIVDRLQKVGDKRAVNPPSVESPEEARVIEAEGTADDEGCRAVETPAMFQNKTECPTCGKWFKQISRHRCKKDLAVAVEEFEATKVVAEAEPNPPATCPPDCECSDTQKPEHCVMEETTHPLEVEVTTHPLEVTEKGEQYIQRIVCDNGVVLTNEEEPPQDEPYGFDLYIDCMIYLQSERGNKAQYFPDIIASLGAAVAKEHNVPVWKAVPYGAGPGYLAQKLESWIVDQGPTGKIMLLSGSPEAQACKDVLIRRAKTVIVGV